VITQQDITTIIGSNAVDNDGDKLGKVGQVYLDDQTGSPEWATISTGLFGTSETFVPLTEASVSGGTLRVPYEKAKVKDAPRVDADQGHLSPAEEEELYRYYGMGGSGQSDTLTSGTSGTAGMAGAAGTAGTTGTTGTTGTGAASAACPTVKTITATAATTSAATRPRVRPSGRVRSPMTTHARNGPDGRRPPPRPITHRCPTRHPGTPGPVRHDHAASNTRPRRPFGAPRP